MLKPIMVILALPVKWILSIDKQAKAAEMEDDWDYFMYEAWKEDKKPRRHHSRGKEQ